MQDRTAHPNRFYDHQLDQGRKRLEGCFRDHPARPAHTGGQELDKLHAMAHGGNGAVITEPAGNVHYSSHAWSAWRASLAYGLDRRLIGRGTPAWSEIGR